MDRLIKICFVKLGYVLLGLTLLFEEHVKEEYLLQRGTDYCEHNHCVYDTVQYRSEKTVGASFDLVCGEEFGTKVLRGTRVQLLLNISPQKGDGPAEFAFIQFMECTEPLHKVYKGLEVICATQSTDD